MRWRAWEELQRIIAELSPALLSGCLVQQLLACPAEPIQLEALLGCPDRLRAVPGQLIDNREGPVRGGVLAPPLDRALERHPGLIDAARPEHEVTGPDRVNRIVRGEPSGVLEQGQRRCQIASELRLQGCGKAGLRLIGTDNGGHDEEERGAPGGDRGRGSAGTVDGELLDAVFRAYAQDRSRSQQEPEWCG